MDLKSDDINVEIDPAILLSYQLGKLSLGNQSDVESVLLAVEGNKINDTTNCPKDPENQNLKTSISNVESGTEELTPETELDSKKDINGNEEPTSDENLNQSFIELEFSDSDNEEKDDEELKLRERGPVGRRTTRSRNRTNFLERNERYDRSEFPPRSLEFLSGSILVQPTNTVTTTNQFSLQNNQLPILNTSETVCPIPSSHPVSSPCTVVYEDHRANSVGSPESGYESSITGSPPRVSFSASVSPSLDLIPETDDDQKIVDLLLENTAECALARPTVHEISEIISYLEGKPSKLSESLEIVASSYDSRDNVPLINNSEDDTNTYSVTSSPRLRHVEIDFRLENKAKQALRDFLSDDEFYAAKGRIYRQINEDIANNRKVKIIHVIDEMEKTSENRTNLHHAVLKSNIEEIYCLVEIQKQYKKPFTDINIRDKYGKTALDYAVQSEMTLVVDYLKENTACQSVNI